MKKQCCQGGGCVKTMNIQYHMIIAAAQTESLGEMRRGHGLTNSAFIQLYELNIECKHGGNITLFLCLWDNKLNTIRSRKYTRLNGTKCPFAFVVEETWDGQLPCNPRFRTANLYLWGWIFVGILWPQNPRILIPHKRHYIYNKNSTQYC